tara:strand:+ start:10787 stop:12415 length:1629 start_codon:yes stop_codon:yes gene_type:complete
MVKQILSPKKQILVYLSMSCIVLFVFSCGKNANSNKDHLAFRYNESSNIRSLDPAFALTLPELWVSNQLFNGLVQIDDDLNILPCIAKSWTISEDGLTYSFALRNDVHFHKHPLFGKDSTRVVVAEDLKYSLNRLKNSKLASPGSWILSKVKDFNVVSDTIFQVILKQPFPGFLGILAMKYCSVVPKEIVEYYANDFRKNPIGTGPFKFKRWEENIKLVFRKNPDYFEKDSLGNRLPYLEAVAITFLPDKQSEFLQFAQGNLDFLNSLYDSYKDELLTTDGKLRDLYAKDVNMIRGPYLNTEYIGFYLDSKTPEVQSELIRKAVNYGFDRQKMLTYLRNGIGKPAYGGFIPMGLAGHSGTIGYTYQPKRAQQLVEEFKKESGIKNPQITLTAFSNDLSYCEFIQNELEKIGLIIQIDVMPPSTMRDARRNGKLDMFRSGWIADYIDAENYLSLFYSENFAPKGSNYFHYKNAEFDSLFNKSYSITTLNERAKLYTKMDSLAMQKSFMVPLYYDEVIRFARKGVTGLGINPINLLDLKCVKKN